MRLAGFTALKISGAYIAGDVAFASELVMMVRSEGSEGLVAFGADSGLLLVRSWGSSKVWHG